MEKTGLTPRRLRILAIHRYFWPDSPPYATMLRHIAQQWVRDGHAVEVLSSQPSYRKGVTTRGVAARQRLDAIRISRMTLPNEVGRPFIRIANAILLALHMAWRAITHRYDVIMISTVPPILGGLSAAICAKVVGARFIYHCMDIQPEVGTVSGEFRHPVLFRLLRRIDTWTCHQAKPVVVLSSDMALTLRRRPYASDLNTRVLNNFSIPSYGDEVRTARIFTDDGRFRVLFAGNIGRFQGLDVAVRAMAILQHREDIEFVVMGDGPAKKVLQKHQQSLGSRVHFMAHQPLEVAKKAMQEVDFGFVSLVPGMYKYAYPSKTMTYLEQGCPIIVAVERESELANSIRSERVGYVIPPSDPEALAALLQKLSALSSDDIAAMRERAVRVHRLRYQSRLVLDEWSQLLAEKQQ